MQIVVGTAATIAWGSSDMGRSWKRFTKSVYPQTPVWAMSSHGDLADELLAGTDQGVLRWRGHAVGWRPIVNDFSDTPVWAIAHSPHDAKLIIAGTRKPASLFRSRDAGKTWEWLPARMAQRCINVDYPRVTRIVFDPDDTSIVWASVEIDGIWRSLDQGDSWERLTSGLLSDDIHGITTVPGRKRVIVATEKGLHKSDDGGASWQHIPLESPNQYTRSVVNVPGAPGRLFCSNGDGPPGSWGRLFRSDDFGDSWREVALPVRANSTVWKIAPHPLDAKKIFTCTAHGQVFASSDGGDNWTKIERELGDIRSLEWAHLGEEL